MKCVTGAGRWVSYIPQVACMYVPEKPPPPVICLTRWRAGLGRARRGAGGAGYACTWNPTPYPVCRSLVSRARSRREGYQRQVGVGFFKVSLVHSL